MIKKFESLIYLILNTIIINISLNAQDTEPPLAKWNMECKGNVFGIVTDMPDNEAVRSNLFKLELDSSQSYNYHFEYGKFIPGETKTVNWKLTVKNLNQDAKALIKFYDSQSNSSTVTIEYFAIKFSIKPEFFSFGNVPLNTNPEHEFTVTNSSEKGTLIFNKGDFLFKNQNFEVLGNSFPAIMKPNEDIKIIVRFNALNDGIFRDSMGLADTCQTYFKAFLEAKVGTPIINVSDAIFGDVNVGGFTKKEVYLVNTGTTELVVEGFSGPKLDPLFQIELPKGITEITPQKPLKLNPGERDTFMITFDPQAAMVYYDSIIFHSDALFSDSIAALYGRGIKSNVTVTSFYDWGRKMIDRSKFPSGPYPPEAGNYILQLKNTGTKDVTITRLDSLSSNKGYAFEFDREIFKGLLLKAGDIKDIPVVFHPVETGTHELSLIYVNSESLPLQTKLTGTGTVPKISTKDYDFGTMMAGDIANIKSKNITFINEDWEYADTLTIFDLDVLPAGNEISAAINIFGTQGFRFDKKLLGIPDNPIKLPPGDSIEFQGQFLAQFDGNHSGILKSNSNALEDKSSTWTGRGTTESLLLSGDSTKICYNQIDTILCSIKNAGSNLINITSLKLEPDLPEFEILDKNLINGFLLDSGDNKIIPVGFNPSSTAGRFTTELVVENSSPDSKIKTFIIGEAIGYEPTSSSHVNKSEIEIGEPLQYRLVYDNGDNLAGKNITMLNIDIDYSSNFLLADLSTLKSGNLLSDKFQIENVEFDNLGGNDNLSRITMTIKALGANTLAGYGDLITLDFKTFLPWYDDSNVQNGQKNTQVTIQHRIYGNEDKCVFFTSRNSEVKLNTKSICIFKDRQIVIGNGTNNIYLNLNSTGNYILKFSIAFDGYTDIRMYNLSGEIVKIILSEELAAGRYVIPLSDEYLSGGVYFITIRSNHYFEAVKFFINK